MPSEAAKKRKEKKKAQARGKPAAKKTTENGVVNGATSENHINGEISISLEKMKLANLSVTGVLMSHPESRDLHLGQISLRYHGAELLTDAQVELNCGRRYGLLGKNGCGNYNFFLGVVAKFCF